MAISFDAVSVSVPATTANLGSGFDSAGLALGLYDDATFELLPSADVEVDIHGEGADTLPRDSHNLMVRAFYESCDTFNIPPMGIRLAANNRIPQKRGLGSSASAIVSGVCAAAAFGGYDIADRDVQDAVFSSASRIEGHPDNVAPAVYGGLTLSWKSVRSVGSEADGPTSFPSSADRPAGSGVSGVSGIAGGPEDGSFAGYGLDPEDAAQEDASHTGSCTGQFYSVRYPVSSQISVYVFIPDFELSTEEARSALPFSVPFSDAAANLGRAALLPYVLSDAPNTGALYRSAGAPEEGSSCGTSMHQVLFDATEDRLHQQYRGGLMPESYGLVKALRAHGFAACISGAGPCVLVLDRDDGEGIADTGFSAVQQDRWRMQKMSVAPRGAVVRTA
ncbi:hypothetical protein HMPREF9156_01201 [Scardovia wiggsiae F0424]|uniref:Homoserine kinase n=1 Tax=Scardovia wiggsiae F0424 TaxID=857290 RepID=J0X015_9BIFI|nr:homoserine kinase [Scardovia wiggsiae]EJD64706.1 hypothetical protein HMPREF9156_01201 [Scardovia wiggsiae F0424]